MKYSKHFKSNIYGIIKSPVKLSLTYGIQAIEGGRLSSEQIETVRRVMARFTRQHGGEYKVRVYPFFPLTKKPNETRMGRGKGGVYTWYANVRANQLLFEYSVSQGSVELSKLIGSKISVSTKLINNL